MKRGIALGGLTADDPVPFEALKAAFMDRRWRMILHETQGPFERSVMCTLREHYEVEGNEVRWLAPCDCLDALR